LPSDVAEVQPTQPFRASQVDVPALPPGGVPSTMQGLPPANRLPAPTPAAVPTAMPAGAWQVPPARPSQPELGLQLTPAQQAAANAKFWVIVLVMVSVAAGVIAAILSS